MFMQELLQKVQFEPVKTSVALTQSYKRRAIPVSTDFEVPQAHDDGDNILGNTALQRRGKHLITNRLRQLNRALVRVHGPDKAAQILGKRKIRDPRLNVANPDLYNKQITRPSIYNPTQSEEVAGRPNTNTGFEALANYLLRTPLMGGVKDEGGAPLLNIPPPANESNYVVRGEAERVAQMSRQEALAREEQQLAQRQRELARNKREHEINSDEETMHGFRRPFQIPGRRRTQKEEEKMGARPPPVNLGLKRINTGSSRGYPFNDTFMHHAENANDRLDSEVVDFLKSKGVEEPLPDLNMSGVGFGGVNPTLISGADNNGNIAALANSFIGNDSMGFDDSDGNAALGAQLQGEMPPPQNRPPVPAYPQQALFDMLAEQDPEMQAIMHGQINKRPIPPAPSNPDGLPQFYNEHTGEWLTVQTDALASHKPSSAADESKYFSFNNEEEEKKTERQPSPRPSQMSAQKQFEMAEKEERQMKEIEEDIKEQEQEVALAERLRRQNSIDAIKRRLALKEREFELLSEETKSQLYQIDPEAAPREIKALLNKEQIAQGFNDFAPNVLTIHLPSGRSMPLEFYVDPAKPQTLNIAKHVYTDSKGATQPMTVADAEVEENVAEVIKFYAKHSSGNGNIVIKYVPRNNTILTNGQHNQYKKPLDKFMSLFKGADTEKPDLSPYYESSMQNSYRAPPIIKPNNDSIDLSQSSIAPGKIKDKHVLKSLIANTRHENAVKRQREVSEEFKQFAKNVVPQKAKSPQPATRSTLTESGKWRLIKEHKRTKK